MSTPQFAIGSLLLMFAAGFGIPMMANLNAGLGMRAGSPFAAVAVLTAVTCMTSAIVLFITGSFSTHTSINDFRGIPPVYFAGGFLFVFYITSITWAAPRIGVGNAIFVVLLGQLVSATVIDHFGLFGAIKSAVTPKRLLGLAVMALGVFLARKEV